MGKKQEEKAPSVTETAKKQVLKGAADDFAARVREWSNTKLGFTILAAIVAEVVLGPTLFKFMPGIDVILFSIFAMPVGAEMMRRGGKEVFLRGVRDSYLAWLGKRGLVSRIVMLGAVVGVELAMTFTHADFIPVIDTWLIAAFGIPVLDSVVTEFWPRGQISEKSEVAEEIVESEDGIVNAPDVVPSTD